MENCVGAVKFRDGEILYVSINEATHTARRKLFRTPEEVESNDGPVPDLPNISDEECITVLPSFMRGKKRRKQENDFGKFTSRASRSLMAITGPCSIEAYQDELSEQASSGKREAVSTGYIREHLTNAVEQIESMYSKDVQSAVAGLATGFDDIDAITSGVLSA